MRENTGDTRLLQAYREHEGDLLRFLVKRLGNQQLAADLAHDLFLKLLRTMEQPAIRDCRAYLFSMAANLATDHQRTENRRREILDEVDDWAWRQRDELTPERHAMARDELAHLEAVIAALPDRCRRVFFLYRFEGLTQPQVAAEMGIGITTVYKDLKRAMSELTRARRDFQAAEFGPGGDRKR